MKVIIPFGPPSTGKGTRIKEVVEELRELWESLGTSNELKAEVKAQTELGKLIKSYMDEGALVPNEIVIGMMIDKIKKSEKNLFLDGFPRTVEQAQALLDAGIKPDLIINLVVAEEVLLERARNRVCCAECGATFSKVGESRPKVEGVCDYCGGELRQRSDDADEAVVRRRMTVYEEETKPVLEFFKNAGVKVVSIDNAAPNASAEFKKLVI